MWVKNIQTAGYNGARTVIYNLVSVFTCLKQFHGVGLGPLSKILAVGTNFDIELF